jgi:hypothetical protein
MAVNRAKAAVAGILSAGESVRHFAASIGQLANRARRNAVTRS